MKKLFKGLLGAGLALSLAACGNGGSQETSDTADSGQAGETVKIGVLQAMEHDSLQDAQDGFIKALEDGGYVEGENVEYQLLNAQGDSSNLQTMSQQLSDNNDLILAIATPAAQSLLNVESEKPILITAVTDPVDAGLVASMEEPGNNVTGTSDAMPVDEQVELLASFNPEAQTMGVVYNSGEANSTIQAEEAIKAGEDLGFEVNTTTVTTTNDVQQAVESLMNDVELLYIPTDNTLASTMATVGDLAKRYQVPIVAGAAAMVEEGGLATYGLNYYDLGYQTGQMAIDIIENGADPATTAIQTAENLEIVVNEDMAEALGIDPASIQIEE